MEEKVRCLHLMPKDGSQESASFQVLPRFGLRGRKGECVNTSNLQLYHTCSLACSSSRLCAASTRHATAHARPLPAPLPPPPHPTPGTPPPML
eukprot:356909-Chlamydomonas_euryale.AAC.2